MARNPKFAHLTDAELDLKSKRFRDKQDEWLVKKEAETKQTQAYADRVNERNRLAKAKKADELKQTWAYVDKLNEKDRLEKVRKADELKQAWAYTDRLNAKAYLEKEDKRRADKLVHDFMDRNLKAENARLEKARKTGKGK